MSVVLDGLDCHPHNPGSSPDDQSAPIMVLVEHSLLHDKEEVIHLPTPPSCPVQVT